MVPLSRPPSLLLVVTACVGMLSASGCAVIFSDRDRMDAGPNDRADAGNDDDVDAGSNIPPPTDLPEGESCSSTAECMAGLECVAELAFESDAPSTKVCRTPAPVGDCCNCSSSDQGGCLVEVTAGECNIPIDEDGCADGLVCFGEVENNWEGGGPYNTVCVEENRREEGQRCSRSDPDACAEGLRCGDDGYCRVFGCDLDGQCQGGDVCVRGGCGSTCAPPSQEGESCGLDAEGCGVTHPCAPDLTCVGSDYENQCSALGAGDACDHNTDCLDGLECVIDQNQLFGVCE